MKEKIEDFGDFQTNLEKILPAIFELQVKNNVILSYLLDHLSVDLSDEGLQAVLNKSLQDELSRLYSKYGNLPDGIKDILEG